MNDNDFALAICPFFNSIRTKGRELACMGQLVAVESVSIRFKTKDGRQEWSQDFCNTFAFEGCPIYQTIADLQE